MAKTLDDWIEQDVAPMRERPISWLSQEYFFRDPARPLYSDPGYFFSPADGIILYQLTVDPDEAILDIKGHLYSVREAMRDPWYDKRSLVIGIFMTFFDVHVNRIPYRGRLSYKELDPLDSHNYPMLAVEKGILDDLRIDLADADYVYNNQRVLNRITVPELQLQYHLLQIADYDVDCVTPFILKQNQPVDQTAPFSVVRFGSQAELIVPLSPTVKYTTLLEPTMHVEAGVDPLIRIDR